MSTANLKVAPDLKVIATHARNVEYNPKRFSAAVLRLRDPKATALVFNSGKVLYNLCVLTVLRLRRQCASCAVLCLIAVALGVCRWW